MKRSESILVYAVTAILAVILVVAVVFGNDDGAADASGTPAGGSAQDLVAALDPGRFAAPADAPVRGSGEPQVQDAPFAPGGEQAGGEQPGLARLTEPDPAGPAPLRRDSGYTPIASLLGPFHVETVADGTSYRVAEVVAGDTFSELCARWTAGTVPAERVLAMNEWIDPRTRMLRAGEQVRFPLFDEAVLLEAQQRRATGARPPAEIAATPEDGRRAAPAATAGESYLVQPGDSLWKIAERRVGARGAPAYIGEIVAANASIRNRDSLRAGERIVLPPVE